MTNIFIEPEKKDWISLCKRPEADDEHLYAIIEPILSEIKKNGDAALRRYALSFDNAVIEELKVTDSEFEVAHIEVNNELKEAIEIARANIYKFHAAYKEKSIVIDTMPGVRCWRKSIPIETAGLYIPGGSAPLFSTLLMLAIPAMIAGCRNIIVCTPCNAEGKVHSSILYTASLLGLTVFKAGGAQAIGAMAYGTNTIPAVNKIFGPGNQLVTMAKKMVNRKGVAIDMPAGPSELLVYADNTCVPAFIAADLLSQAEHGPDSQVVLVAENESIIDKVRSEIVLQLKELEREKIIRESLLCSRYIVLKDINKAFEFINYYAPEHFIIASDNSADLSDKVINAGSVFLGNFSPESAGDYASGTNHTLPTNGFAKSYSGVSVDSFIKKITYQEISAGGLAALGKTVEIMAATEGLQAHKNAVSIRLNKYINDED